MLPKHIAISLEQPSQDYQPRLKIIKQLISLQLDSNIPLMTLYLLDSKPADFSKNTENLSNLFTQLSTDSKITKNQIKITVLGKWYNLPSKLVEQIKKLIDQTSSYDKFFLNLCINYDGQQEIVDACQLLARKIQADKLDPLAITKELIKETIYTSYFIAPDLIIINNKTLNTFLMWDSANSRLHFTNKHWSQLTIQDIKKAIELYNLMN